MIVCWKVLLFHIIIIFRFFLVYVFSICGDRFFFKRSLLSLKPWYIGKRFEDTMAIVIGFSKFVGRRDIGLKEIIEFACYSKILLSAHIRFVRLPHPFVVFSCHYWSRNNIIYGSFFTQYINTMIKFANSLNILLTFQIKCRVCTSLLWFLSYFW